MAKISRSDLKDPEIKALYEEYNREASIAGSMGYGEEMFMHRRKSAEAFKKIEEILEKKREKEK